MEKRYDPLLLLLLLVQQPAPRTVTDVDVPTLVGFASLPAETFAPGPTSGQFIGAANGVTPPFAGRQPVQGFSSILRVADGEFLALVDNGFGAKANSPDHLLRAYRLRVSPTTRTGGAGSITVLSPITLRDPNRRVPFPIVADAPVYPGGRGGIPVDPAVVSGRLLTGSDFDVESFRAAPDGSLWFGDEFGPFLLHTDAAGVLLDAPFSLEGARSPQHPLPGAPTLAASRGFEGMGQSADGRYLYPMLEGTITGAPAGRLRIQEFDTATKAFTTRQWIYPLEDPTHSIGDLTLVTDRIFLVIERDDRQGAEARFKKVFAVHLDAVDAQGGLLKREVVDLLNIADPDRLGGTDPVFRFPFQTIESQVPISDRELALINDNNFPFSAARRPGAPDANEFIIVRLPRAIRDYAPAPQRGSETPPSRPSSSNTHSPLAPCANRGHCSRFG